MCDVTRQNFEEKYHQVIDDLQSASFISIDCEFSGLFDEENRCSLFDTPKERFKKVQSALGSFLIVQFGLSTFKYERGKNRFHASTYNFYILPSPLFKSNSKFSCQIGSIEFLCKHKFNFNKLFYDGINFLCKADEAEALHMIKEKGLDILDISEVLQKYCSEISNWSRSVPEGSEMILEIQNEREPFIYVLHQEIRNLFSNIWTYYETQHSMRIKKLKTSEKRQLMSDEEETTLNKKLFDSLLGFSRVIKEIQHSRKPIIGHNLFLDLIMIYKQFYNPSPVSYKEFKQNITNLFPNLYDTKNISFRLREILPRDTVWKSNCLPDLYHFLKEGKGATVVLFSPVISHKDEDLLREHFHEAGFDSYCTGFCFLKMAHMFSLWDEQTRSFAVTTIPIVSSRLSRAIAPMKNCVNIIRGQVNHIVLDGPDPKSTRPELLYIRGKKGQPLRSSKISQVTAKHGPVDIQLLNKCSALMAVGNERQFREILESFKNHKEYTVSKYSFLRHSGFGKLVVPGGVVVSIAVLAVLLSKGNFQYFSKAFPD